MKLTDELDLNSNIARNMQGAEMVELPSSPGTVVSGKGRYWIRDDGSPMFTDDTDTDYVLNVGAGSSAKIYTFRYDGGFPPSQTDTEPFDLPGGFTRILIPSNFSLVKAALQSSSPCIAGTLALVPTINGTKVTNPALNLQLNSTTKPIEDFNEVAPGSANLIGVAGDKVGVKLTSSALWAHGIGNIRIDLYINFI